MNGKLEFNGQAWRISDLKPHVSVRFKQIFKGIDTGRVPPFVLKDRPDIVADLHWFMERYPLTVDDDTAGKLAGKLAKYHADRGAVGDLMNPNYMPPLINGFRPPEAPEPHQTRAAHMLRTTGRLLLLDDVGLGKTVSALAAMADGWGLPAVIVVDSHLATQWIVEYINRFTFLKAIEIKDRKPRKLQPADIYVFRYSNISAWADYAKSLGIGLIVFDEIQGLRHGMNTDKGRGARAFVEAAQYRMGLTATPIYNYGSEIFNVVEFIAPGVLGSWSEFLINWCTSHGTHWIVKEPEALGSYLQEEGITLRRTDEDAEIVSTRPPLYKTLLEVEWDDGSVQTDRDLQQRLALRVLNGSFNEKGQAARELDLLVRQETGIAKARSVAAYVRTLVEAGEPVILGGWHREVYRIWNECLADLNPVMFTGSETTAAKGRAKKKIQQGESDLIIMSLRSGSGTDGLQQRIAHAVIGEFDWSPQVHRQFIGRVWRPGQTRPVTGHYLHVDGGSDPVLMPMLGLKASQSHGILNPYASAPEATPTDDTRMIKLAKRILGRGGEEDG